MKHLYVIIFVSINCSPAHLKHINSLLNILVVATAHLTHRSSLLSSLNVLAYTISSACLEDSNSVFSMTVFCSYSPQQSGVADFQGRQVARVAERLEDDAARRPDHEVGEAGVGQRDAKPGLRWKLQRSETQLYSPG